jgi:hypothetical protein
VSSSPRASSAHSLLLQNHASFPSKRLICTPRFTTKNFTKFVRPSNLFLPCRMTSSMFSSSPHPSADFKTLFSTSSQRSSAPRSRLSKSQGFPPKTASLSYSVASGIVSGKSFTRPSNFSKKLSAARIGRVHTVGISAVIEANVPPCSTSGKLHFTY